MMNRKIQQLIINSSAGGNGDIWMRLISFYTVAGLCSDLEIHILVPFIFRKLANNVFGDRLVIITNETDYNNADMLVYTSLGFIQLLKGILKGTKYIAPYQRAIIHDKKKKKLKDSINTAVFNITDFFGLIQVPAWKYIKGYQGFLDIIAIKKLRHLNYETFTIQLESDYNFIHLKLVSANIPTSLQLTVPNDLGQHTLIFPTGTARQFMPVWWAKKYFPNAYFAFFFKDQDAAFFLEHGLKVIYFYSEPGDILNLAKYAKWTISTDSFPSHLLQSALKKCTVAITEVLKTRIVSPIFKGKVIDSQVICHPCLHLDRTNNPICAAGHYECLNWKNKLYTQLIISSVE